MSTCSTLARQVNLDQAQVQSTDTATVQHALFDAGQHLQAAADAGCKPGPFSVALDTFGFDYSTARVTPVVVQPTSQPDSNDPTVAQWVGIAAGALLVWSLIALIPAAVAHSKGRSFSFWYGLGLIVGIFAILPVLVIRPRICPYCREAVKPEATVCRHCHREYTL